jgi:hypothetical protein
VITTPVLPGQSYMVTCKMKMKKHTSLPLNAKTASINCVMESVSEVSYTRKITERQVIEIWKRALSQEHLISQDGESVEVKYPGRPNDDRGADFRDAVVTTSQGTKKGHIEIHSLTSGWQAHGHHRDPVYNQVVLHVASRQAGKAETVLENGNKIPTVVLNETVLNSAVSPSNNESLSFLRLICHPLSG